MVQRGGPLQRDFFPTRDGWHDRSFLDISQDNRFTVPPLNQQPVHPRVLPVETALKDCAGLAVKEFALYVVDDNGAEKAYTSTSLTPFQQRIFSEKFRQDFRKNVQRVSRGSNPHSEALSYDGSFSSDFDTESDFRVRHSTASGESSSEGPRRHRNARSEETDDDSTNGRFPRKRQRPQYEDDTPVPVVKTQQLAIGNDADIDKFYAVRFKDMQQSSCKIMGKAFVKLIEPKKQTHYPYTKGASKAPPWWPETTGENHVRHKEPDHLLKPERIILLVHILKMIIEPHDNQCDSVQKLGLNVKKLEEATMEAMSNWFNDKDHKENAQKRVFLKEIFKVARAQERYKNGEIDGTTRISVQFGDVNGQEESDNDDPDEGIKDEEDEPCSANIHSSDISAAMLQTQMQQQEPDFFRARPIPVRYHTQPHSQVEDQGTYPDSFMSRNMNVGFQQVSPTAQDPSRRAFPSSFQTQSQAMYTWQNNMATTASPSQFYVTSPQTTMPPQSNSYQLPPPTTVGPQGMLPPPLTQHSFDGLPTSGRFDSGPALGNQLRTGSLGHPHHLPPGFSDIFQDSGYGHNEPEIKHNRNMLPS